MIDFTVMPDGREPYKVTATTRTILFWEKIGKDNTMSRVLANPAMSDLYSLAHLASKRGGMFNGTLAEFEELVDLDFEFETQPDPTPQALSPESA